MKTRQILTLAAPDPLRSEKYTALALFLEFDYWELNFVVNAAIQQLG